MKKEENKNTVARKAAEKAAVKAAKAVAVFAATEKATIEAANARIAGGLSKLAASFFAAGVAAKAAGLSARYVLSAPAAVAAFKDYAAARNAAVTQTAAYKAAFAATDCAARGVYPDFAAYTAAIKAAGGRWAKNPAPAAEKSAAIKAGVAAKKAAQPAKKAAQPTTAQTETASRPVVAPSAPTPAKSDDAKTRAEKARAALAAVAAFTDGELIAAARDNRVAAKRLFAVLTAALADATATKPVGAKKTA